MPSFALLHWYVIYGLGEVACFASGKGPSPQVTGSHGFRCACSPGLRLPPQLCTVTVQASHWRRVFHARSAAACLCAHVQLSGMVMSSCSNCHGTQDCKHPDWVCCPSLLLPAATEVSFTNFTVVWRALRLGPSFRCHGSGDVDAFHNMKTIRPRM